MAKASAPSNALGFPELLAGELRERVTLVELLAGTSDGPGLIDVAFWEEWRRNIPRSEDEYSDGHDACRSDLRDVRKLLNQLAPDLLSLLPVIDDHDRIRRMDAVDLRAAAAKCRRLLDRLWPQWEERIGSLYELACLAKLPYGPARENDRASEDEIVLECRRNLTALLWPARQSNVAAAEASACRPDEAAAHYLDQKSVEILRLLHASNALLTVEAVAHGVDLTEKPTRDRLKELIAAGLVVRPHGERRGVGLTVAGKLRLADLPENSR